MSKKCQAKALWIKLIAITYWLNVVAAAAAASSSLLVQKIGFQLWPSMYTLTRLHALCLCDSRYEQAKTVCVSRCRRHRCYVFTFDDVRLFENLLWWWLLLFLSCFVTRFGSHSIHTHTRFFVGFWLVEQRVDSTIYICARIEAHTLALFSFHLCCCYCCCCCCCYCFVCVYIVLFAHFMLNMCSWIAHITWPRQHENQIVHTTKQLKHGVPSAFIHSNFIYKVNKIIKRYYKRG